MAEQYGDDVASAEAVRTGIWSPFRSLLAAQVLTALLGLVFWVVVARLVDAHDVGVAAAAINAQTLLGIVTVLGHSTTLVSELPKHEPARQRTMILRSLLVVLVSSAVAGGVLVAVSPLLSSNLADALGNPIGAACFVLGTAGFAWALVVDDACLGVKQSGLQVWRNLLASSLRFPLTALLLVLGFTEAHVLQLCWVLPLLGSIPFTLWRLRLPRGDRTSPPLLRDIRAFQSLAIRNHLLSLCLAAGSQMVPVVAALTLSSVGNAEFAIAWLMANFVFLPPYLLATALFAHAANATTEEFRRSMERTIPAALSLSLLLCVGAWVLGEPVLWIFGGDYARHSWAILALLVPAGLWMVLKDHLVVLWRSQQAFSLATRLTGTALVIEVLGATSGGIIGGARGLCLGWLAAMGVEMVLGLPWLRRAFGGLHWRSPLPARRTEAGVAASQVVLGAVLVVTLAAGTFWVVTQRQAAPDRSIDASTGLLEPGAPVPTCEPTAEQPGPAIDLNVQSATGDPAHPIRSAADLRRLVGLAQAAGAGVISTTTSFRTMQPVQGGPIEFEYVDRTIAAARAAGMQVRLQLIGMPDWALDEPQFENQAPRSQPELAAWSTFVTEVMKHVAGQVDYLEVWNEPNEAKWWPTGPDPVEFARLMDVTDRAVHAVAPQTKVISGGLASNDIGFLTWVYRGIDQLGLERSPFDMVGAHPFAGDHAPDSVDPTKRYERNPFGLYDENFTGFMGLHEVMAQHGDGDLPVYITQFGYSTRAGQGREAVPDDLRASYLTQAFKQATCVPYVPVFSWYALHPTPWDPQEYTLVDRQLRPTKTYDALVAWGRQRDEAAGTAHPKG
ncbi:oligosaccharide flippase family protein [Nocardioides anomalus]|uniref:Oligosaccharide flippase family protein n=1 Tax=Nocardioides anomalus TaxID=2712223 RepID=A0A6G6WD04_9ACTN|nr:oligosaccharide flippase family protein [Nocardioides anomalus]QIG43099.1 oligosaccharide flippase family protein [Nocardioides anomalus]